MIIDALKFRLFCWNFELEKVDPFDYANSSNITFLFMFFE